MAIAFDTVTGSSTTGTSLSVAHTASGSDRIAVTGAIGENSSDLITGATYGGVAMTEWVKFQIPGWRWLYFYYILNPPTSAENVVVTASSSTFIQLMTGSYNGVAQVAPEAPSAGSRTNGGSSVDGTTGLSTSATTLTDNAWVVQFVGAQSGGITALTATTQRNAAVVAALQDSGGPVTPAGLRTLIAKPASTTAMGAAIMVLAPSAGGGGGGGLDPHLHRARLLSQAVSRGSFY